jgi:AbrB family looped-hinge helix DNA binding protein
MQIARLTTRGRLTIPSAIRKRLKLRKGMKLVFREEDGQVIVTPLDKKYFHRFAGSSERKENY